VDDGSAAVAGADGEGAADQARAVAHGLDADALAVAAGVIESDAVVGDREPELVVGDAEVDDDGAGFAVFDGVADGLLGDAEEVGGGGVVVDLDLAVGDEEAGDAEDGLGFGGEVAEGGGEAVGLERDGLEAVGELAGLGDGAVDEFGDFADAVGLGG
jgi:hypothetical protein